MMGVKKSTTRPNTAKKAPSLSEQAAIQRLLQLLKSGQDTRHRKIRRISAAVRSRRYENDLKIDIAAERLFRSEFRD